MKFLVSLTISVALVAGVVGCSGKDEPLFVQKPECLPAPEGQSIVPLAGQHPMVISFLEIGTADEGFDLDHDGLPDNKLSAVGTLARGAIEDAF